MKASVILTDKPQDITSRKWDDLVAKELNLKKSGHVGTLDPMATGLQIILSGKATKLLQFFLDSEKNYQAEVTLGFSTDTWDKEGIKTTEKPVETTEEAILKAIDTFRGVITQQPPPYSAIKVDGKPMYYWTRKGIHKPIPTREVEVYSISNINIDIPRISFDISCAKGTYIRAIANELGQKLGTEAHLSALRRTKIGPFSVNEIDSSSNNISYKALTPLQGLSFLYPIVCVNSEQAKAIGFGQYPILHDMPESDIFIIEYNEQLLAIAEIDRNKPNNYKLRTVIPV